jgi:ABC-type glycerol-3-phosphate transport system permease component
MEMINYIYLFILFIFYFFPIYWIAISSFKPMEEIMTASPRLFPMKPTVENYINLFNPEALYGGLERAGKFFLFFIRNSLLVSTSTTIICIVLSTLGGYALSRFRFKGADFFSRMMLLIYLFPGILLLVPIYEIMSKLNLMDSHLSLIIVYVALTTPFCLWLIKAFFDTIPIELEEAASIDGLNRIGVFLRITLPLSKPGILTITVYSFIVSWSEYLFASILIFSDFKKTVAPGLVMYMGYQYIEWGSLLAGATICTLPVLILFIPLARYFLRGLISGALKF